MFYYTFNAFNVNFLVGSRTRTLKILSIFSIVYMYVINFAGIPPWVWYLRRFKSCVQLVETIIAKIIENPYQLQTMEKYG